MKEMIIGINKAKQVLLILGSVLFVGVGVYMLTADGIDMGWLANCIFILAMIFFGYAGFVSLKRLLRDTYVIKMNDQGLYSDLFKETCFLWTDILRVFEFKVSDEEVIGIELVDEEKYVEALSPILQKACACNIGLGFPAFCLSAVGTDYTCDELLKWIQEYLEFYTQNPENRL